MTQQQTTSHAVLGQKGDALQTAITEYQTKQAALATAQTAFNAARTAYETARAEFETATGGFVGLFPVPAGYPPSP